MGRKRTAAAETGPAPREGTHPIDTGTAELVRDRDNPHGWLLYVNGVQSSHLDLSRPDLLDFEYMDWMAKVLRAWRDAARAHDDGRAGLSVLHLGGGGCAFPRYVAHAHPGSHNTVVELDGKLAGLARSWFALPPAPAVKIRVGEAGAVLRGAPDATRDVVVRDVFAGSRTPPALTTVDFDLQVRRVLRPGGLYLANCGDTSRLLEARAEARALGEVFGTVAAVADPAMLKGRRHGNVVLMAWDGGDTEALARARRTLLAGGSPARMLSGRELEEWAGPA